MSQLRSRAAFVTSDHQPFVFLLLIHVPVTSLDGGAAIFARWQELFIRGPKPLQVTLKKVREGEIWRFVFELAELVPSKAARVPVGYRGEQPRMFYALC